MINAWIIWGGAVDEKTAYYGLSGGVVAAVQLATGEKLWYNPLKPPAGRGRAGNSAADGHTIWEYDTTQEFTTVNDVPARGGPWAQPDRR